MEDHPPASTTDHPASKTTNHTDDNNNNNRPSDQPPSAASQRKPASSHGNQIRPHHQTHHQSRQSRNSLGDASIHEDEDDEEEFNKHYAADLDQNTQSPALPEFIASGGGTGIFKVPTRAAVHPSRPPCLELRPHPLRETQAGKFLRNIACTETQLWAGQENGVRFWRFEDSYAPGLRGRVRRGEEDAAPFHESANTSPTMCLLVDSANRLIWSGHKDGKVRSWKMDQAVENNEHFKEGLSWQAHRTAVHSIVMSFYGDMWTGGEGGWIKIWPWESIEKSLSLKPEEKHMAALLVERSFVDLRSQVTINGTCSISSADIKFIMSDHIRAKIWIVQPLSFSLWEAHTKELIKVFNIEGQIENRVEMPSGDQPSEDEVKVKSASTGKKDKPQGFLQRSRNAIMGAADAVRRVATRGAGAFVEDNAKKTEAVILTPDGMIWSGCSTGMLIQWDGNGTKLHDITHHPRAVQCFCTFGRRIYIGYVSGYVQVMDLDGHLIAGWVAHNGPVIKMAVGNGCIYSLATHGGVRAWNITSPGPIDNVLRSELKERALAYQRKANLKILIGTWNVGQGRASHDALMTWLGSVASDVGIVVVGLQEVDMGAGFLAMSAAKETVGLEGSAVGNWWLDAIGKILDENLTFERMGSRQLAGLQIGLWVRKNLRNHAGDVDIGAVPCGFGRAIGNKGGVGLRIRVLDRIICFVNCHLAAHLEAVNRRNADFDHIYRSMVFARSSHPQSNVASSIQTNAQSSNKNTNQAQGNNNEDTRMELADADMVVFTGDFNYRLFGMSYDEARDFVSQRCFDWLREKDQLRAEMKAGKVFQGMREAIITFPPTYKFERGRPGLAGYDSGEKKRIPAWCDRVIYRDNRAGPVEDCSLECPIVSSILMYEACMDVVESDHKPVRCKFLIKIAHVERSVRRQQYGEIMKSNEEIQDILEHLKYVPETVVSTNRIVLQNQDTAVLLITSQSAKDEAVFKIICEGQCIVKEDGEEGNYRPRGCSGFPRWLEVTPAAGIVKPEQTVDVQVHHEEFKTPEDLVDGIPQNWLSEDAREKEVILAVIVGGSSSTETITHRVYVRHCFSAKPIPIGLKSSSNKSNNQSSDSVENR